MADEIQNENIDSNNPLEGLVSTAKLEREKRQIYRETQGVAHEIAEYNDELQDNIYFRAFRATGITAESQLDDPGYFLNSFNYLVANELTSSEEQNSLRDIIYPADLAPEKKGAYLEFYRLLLSNFPNYDTYSTAKKGQTYLNFIDKYAPAELKELLKKEDIISTFYEKVTKVRYQMQKGYKMIKSTESRIAEITETNSGVKKNLDSLINNYKRAGRQIPPEIFVAVTTLGIILSFTKYSKLGFGLLTAGLGSQVIMNMEVPNPKNKLSKEYQRLYLNNTLREGRKGKKSVAMLESMTVTATAKFNFGTYWKLYREAKKGRSLTELQDQYSGETNDDKIPQLVFDAINLKDRTTAFEAMYAFEKANLNLIQELQDRTIELEDGRTLNAWEAFLKLPFGTAVKAVTMELGNGQKLEDGFSSIFGRLYNYTVDGTMAALDAGTEAVDNLRRDYLGEGRDLKVAMSDIGIEDSEYDSARQLFRVYGIEFELKSWIDEDAKEAGKVPSNTSKGARFNYYDGTKQEEIDIWFKDKENPTKEDFEKISKLIFQSKLEVAGFPSNADIEWDDQLKPPSWKYLYNPENTFGVKVDNKTLILRATLNKEEHDPSKKYLFSFYDKDDKEEKMYSSKEKFETYIYTEALQKEFSKLTGIPADQIKISPDDLENFKTDNASLKASLRKGNVKVELIFHHASGTNGDKWSYEIVGDNNNQNDFINLIFLNLEDEIYNVNRANLFGYDMPFRKTFADMFGDMAGLDDREWESMVRSLAIFVKAKLSSIPENNIEEREKYIKKVAQSTSSLVDKLKEYQHGGARAKEVPPEGIFENWRKDLGEIEIDSAYKKTANNFKNDLLDDIKFDNYEMSFDLYYFYNSQLEEEFSKHPNLSASDKESYAKYISRKYYDLTLRMDRDENEYIKQKDKFVIGSEFAPSYANFIKEGSDAKKENELMQIEEKVFDEKEIQNLLPQARVIIKAYALRKRTDYLAEAKKTGTNFEDMKKRYEEEIRNIKVDNIAMVLSQETRDEWKKFTGNIGDGMGDMWKWTKEGSLGEMLNWLAEKLGYLVGDILGASLKLVYYILEGTYESITEDKLIDNPESIQKPTESAEGKKKAESKEMESKEAGITNITRDRTTKIPSKDAPKIVLNDFQNIPEISNIPQTGIADEHFTDSGPWDAIQGTFLWDQLENFQKHIYAGDIVLIRDSGLNPLDDKTIGKVIAVDEEYITADSPNGIALVYNYAKRQILSYPLERLYKSIDYQVGRDPSAIEKNSFIIVTNDDGSRSYGRYTGKLSKNTLGGYSLQVRFDDGKEEMVDMDDISHLGSQAESKESRKAKEELGARHMWSRSVDDPEQDDYLIQKEGVNYILRDVVDSGAESGNYDVVEIMAYSPKDGHDDYSAIGQIFIHKSGIPIKIVPTRNGQASNEIYTVNGTDDAKAVIETLLDVPSNQAYTEVRRAFPQGAFYGMEIVQTNEKNPNEGLGHILDNQEKFRTLYVKDTITGKIIASIEIDNINILEDEKHENIEKLSIRIFKYDEHGKRQIQVNEGRTTNIYTVLADLTEMIEPTIRAEIEKKKEEIIGIASTALNNDGETIYNLVSSDSITIYERERVKRTEENLAYEGDILHVYSSGEEVGAIRISHGEGHKISYLKKPVGPWITESDWIEYKGDMKDLIDIVTGKKSVDQKEEDPDATTFERELGGKKFVFSKSLQKFGPTNDMLIELESKPEDYIKIIYEKLESAKGLSNDTFKDRHSVSMAVQMALYLFDHESTIGTIDGFWGNDTTTALNALNNDENVFDRDGVKAEDITDKMEAIEMIKIALEAHYPDEISKP